MDRRRIPLQISDRLLGVRASDGRRVTGVGLRNLYRECIRIAWPSTVEGVLMSVIGSMDTMMVGTLGPAAIAAVGLTGQPRMILLVLAQALCVGTTALCARRKGADNHAGAVQCLMQSLCFVTVLGVLITLLGTFGARPLMVIAGANEDTMEMSVAYFRIMSLGLLFTCWSLCICAAMRGIGQTRITLVTNMTANLVNVCLNYLLINGHFGFPALGVRGAALATSISAAVGCAVAVSFLLRKNSYFRFTLPRFDRATLSGLYQIGSSSILETVCLRAGFLIMARLIAGTGTSSFAAYQIVQQVTSLSFVLGDGVATAGTSLVGQSLGAEREDLAQVHVAIVRRIGVFVSAGLMILIFLLRRQLAQLFTTDEEIIHAASISFLAVIIAMVPQNSRVICSGCLRGAGDVKFVAACALLSVTILRPVLTYLSCYPLNRAFPGMYLSVLGPWIAFAGDAYLRSYLLGRRIRQGKWTKIRLS